jgi:hypothetical protein
VGVTAALDRDAHVGLGIGLIPVAIPENAASAERYRYPAAPPGPRRPSALAAMALPPPVAEPAKPADAGMLTQMPHRDYHELQLPK